MKTKIIAQIITSALEFGNNIPDATDDLFAYLTDECRMCEDLANRHTNSIAAAARQNDALAGCKHGLSHELDRRISEVLGANLPSNIGQVLTKRLAKILAAHGY